MGQKQSNTSSSFNYTPRRQPEVPQAHRDSYRLLSTLVGDRYKRHLLAKLQGDEAQSMADFLNRILESESSLEHSERKFVLHTLSLLAKLARVFPECLKLVGVECKFDPAQVHQGSCGDIYKGTFTGGQVVCVKVIRGVTTGYTYEQLLKIHAKEAILSAHLMHPNIVPFYGVCDLSQEDINRVCIISAWMDHGNLLSYLKRQPDAPRYLLMSDIISGLDHMHGLEIIHSDLQAKNVLVSNEGRALLANFGASRVSIATQTGTVVGGMSWTSPELFLGTIAVTTQQCDIWSYACTCYEVLTGAKPFSEFTGNIPMLMAAFKERRAVPTHPALTPEKVDERILKKMKRCWDYEPSKRPTAKEICELFRGLALEDNRDPRDGGGDSRISSDDTKVNYEMVLEVLQRVQQTPTPSTPSGKKTPVKRR